MTTAERAPGAQQASLIAYDKAVINQLAVEHMWLPTTPTNRGTTEPELRLSNEQLVGAINAACENLPDMTFWQRGLTTTETQPMVGAHSQVFDAKAELLRERESFTLDDAMAYLRDDNQEAYSVAFVGVGVAIGAVGTFKTKLFKPKWSAEINPVQQKIWVAFTKTACLGNFFELDPDELPWVFLLILTLPCTDYSTAGKRKGDAGDTGWMFLEAIRRVLSMPKRPKMIELETADGILTTNNGKELALAEAMLSEFYVVKVRKVSVALHGSVSHRKRMVMACIDKDFVGADDFEMPAPTWGTNGKVACARDVAVDDVLALATLDDKHRYPGRLATRYDRCHSSASRQPEVGYGELLKLGRIAPGMGHSQRPHLGLHGGTTQTEAGVPSSGWPN